MTVFSRLTALAVIGAIALAGCGGDDDEETSSGASKAPAKAKTGGDLTVLYNGDVDNIDPGIAYYQYSFTVQYALHRPLYSYKPDDAKTLEPDLAAGPADISEDGKTVTIKIRPGVKFSPPVNREVKSDDVAYAIERAFTSKVNGPYVGAYMGDLQGLKAFQDGKAKRISGIQTPDDQTIVFKLDRPRGAIVTGALSMPVSAPVPREYARKFDNVKGTSKYGQNQVFTGPYMIENNAQGRLTGYKPGREIRMVRNPNWDKSTDYRPAYLDSITVKEGVEPEVGSRQILSGTHQVSGDFQIPASIMVRASRNQKDQVVTTPPTGRYRYIAFNTRIEPFDDINVRKAIIAAFDREGLRQAFGGPVTGQLPTHFIPPGQPGFEEAGGEKGPGLDFLANPKGDMALAQEYMKKAGYASGKYDGDKEFTAIGDNATQQENVSEAAVQEFAKLGFKVKLRSVSRDAMYTTYCQVPSKEPDICPSVGWLKDFADPETLLNAVFNGKNILDQGNSNFSLLDNEALNAEIRKAEVINDPAERNQAWGEIDKKATELAPGVPWLWDTQPMLESKDVSGVVNRWNASWDLSHTSIK